MISIVKGTTRYVYFLLQLKLHDMKKYVILAFFYNQCI